MATRAAAMPRSAPATRSFGPTVLRWNDAQASCKAWGGDLAAVGSCPEYSFMLCFVSKDTWIGANDVAVEGTFMWTTQEPFVFTSWDTGYPQDTNHSLNCVSIGSALTWQDAVGQEIVS